MRVGVSGHQELPPQVEVYVSEVTRARFASLSGLVVVSSLAAGADQLIAELALERGGELEVVVPCHGYEETFGGPARAGYLRLLSSAEHVETLPFASPGEEAFMAAGRQVVERSDELVAVWDGLPARGLGGTADVVSYARSRDIPVAVVWPSGVERAPAS